MTPPVPARRIGMDFDNTIADYDDLIHGEAVARGLVEPSAPKIKREVRDRIRLLPGGEVKWQKLQASVYGPLMRGARLFPGVLDFLARAKAAGIPVCVVSHKSERYPYDESGTNHREAARSWMEAAGLFGEASALSRESLYFEDTRAAKVARIGVLSCSHFIDDLEETFLEPGFPSGVERILFDRRGAYSNADADRRASSWKEISERVFDAAA